MEASDLLGLQIPSNEAHVWARAATPGASCSRFSEVGGPGGSSSSKKSDSREGPRNHTQCRAEGTSWAPEQRFRPGCTDSVTTRPFPMGVRVGPLKWKPPVGLSLRPAGRTRQRDCPPRAREGARNAPPHTERVSPQLLTWPNSSC